MVKNTIGAWADGLIVLISTVFCAWWVGMPNGLWFIGMGILVCVIWILQSVLTKKGEVGGMGKIYTRRKHKERIKKG